mgnify:CR=1 FL=1
MYIASEEWTWAQRFAQSVFYRNNLRQIYSFLTKRTNLRRRQARAAHTGRVGIFALGVAARADFTF